MKMKRFALFFGLVFILVSSLGLVACNIDPCDDPMLGGDCYYSKDPSYATAQAALRDSQRSQALLTQEAMATPMPTIAVYEATLGPMTTDLVYCSTVVTNLYRAIIAANGGTYPPDTYVSVGVQVGYPNADDTDVVIQLLSYAMTSAPILHEGDLVCISINPDLIKAKIQATLP